MAMTSQIETLRLKYESMEIGVSPTEDLAIAAIESELGVHLPMDFKAIAKFFSGGMVGGLIIHQFSNEPESCIVADTRFLRGFGNPHECIVLSNDECGMLYLLTDDNIPAVYHTERMPLPDAIANGQVFKTWGSFLDFFREMVGVATQ